MAKIFNGLGQISNPFDPTGASSTTTIGSSFLSNKSIRLVMDQSAKSFLNGVVDLGLSTPNRLTNLTSAPFLSARNSFSYLDKKSPVLMVPNTNPVTFSEESGPGVNETFFNEFLLEATPFYNFYTDDETINDEEEVGDRKFEDIPRFIKLTWQKAPDLQSQKLELSNKRANYRYEKKINISLGKETIPEHLIDENFSMVAKSLANNILFGPVINSIVEIQETIDSFDDIVSPDDFIDEDLFLTDESLRGVELSELKLNVNQIFDPIYNTSRFGEANDSQVSIVKPLTSQQNLKIKLTDPQAIPIQIDSKVQIKDTKLQDIGILNKISQNINNSIKTNTNTFLKVKFINPAISGLIKDDRVANMIKPEHVENLLSVGTLLPQLEILSKLKLIENQADIDSLLAKTKSFQSPEGIKEFEYVGYQIEKSKLDDGRFRVVDTIDIADIYSNEYYDARVLYGETYRYRIRVIFRWTRKENTVTVSNFSTRKTLPLISYYFSGEWAAPSAQASVLDLSPPDPPDELTIYPDSKNKRILISIKIPRNNQRDIDRMHILRKLKDKDGNDLTNWETIASTHLRNTLYPDRDVDYFENNGIKYVYTSMCSTKHNESSLLSEQYVTMLCKDWKVIGEYPLEYISTKGVRLDNFGAFSTIPYQERLSEVIIKTNEDDTKNNKSIEWTVGGRETFTNRLYDDQKYLVRVESLDTGEISDTYIDVKYNGVKEEKRKVNSPPSLRPTVIDRKIPGFGRLF